MNLQQHSFPHQQRGASSTGIVLIIFTIVVGAKLLLAILPAQIDDYQMTTVLTNELEKANTNKKSAKEFINSVNNQLAINASDGKRAEDFFTFTNDRTGELVIHKQYTKTSHFFGNVDIVNRFDDVITTDSDSQ